MSTLKKFPHQILTSIKFVGRGDYPFNSEGCHEFILDEQGRPWVATNGILAPWIFANHGQMPNYADPRTTFRAVCIGDHPEAVTTLGWYTDSGILAEEHPSRDAAEGAEGYDPLWDVPPDRRMEWETFMASQA